MTPPPQRCDNCRTMCHLCKASGESAAPYCGCGPAHKSCVEASRWKEEDGQDYPYLETGPLRNPLWGCQKCGKLYLVIRPTSVSRKITERVDMEAIPTACIWAVIPTIFALAVYGILYMTPIPMPPGGVILVGATAFIVAFFYAFALHTSPDMMRYRRAVRKRLAEAHPVAPYNVYQDK